MGILDDFRQRVDSAAQYIASGLGLGVFGGSGPTTALDWLLLSGLAHRVVWAPAEDALAEGWRTDTDAEQDATADFDALTRLEDRATEAMGAARVYGGSYLWPVTDDVERWGEPLTEGEHNVSAVHVVTGREAVPRTWDSEPGSPGFGRPATYNLTIVRGSSSWSGVVHASRLVYVPGSPAVPDQRLTRDHLDVPTLDLYLAAVADLERGWSSTASLLTRLSVWWIRLKRAANTAANNGVDTPAATTLAGRLEIIRSTVSTRSLLPLGEGDEVGWSGPSVAGVRDLVTAIMERVSAVEGIPLTILFGQAPGGLSTDDKGGRSAYNRILARLRRIVLSPVLLEVYAIRFGPGTRRIVWPELDRPTAAEAATISLTQAQRDETLIRIGAIVDAESRARFDNGEEMPLPVLDEVYAIVPGDQRKPESEPVAADEPVAVEEPAAVEEVEEVPDGEDDAGP